MRTTIEILAKLSEKSPNWKILKTLTKQERKSDELLRTVRRILCLNMTKDSVLALLQFMPEALLLADMERYLVNADALRLVISKLYRTRKALNQALVDSLSGRNMRCAEACLKLGADPHFNHNQPLLGCAGKDAEWLIHIYCLLRRFTTKDLGATEAVALHKAHQHDKQDILAPMDVKNAACYGGLPMFSWDKMRSSETKPATLAEVQNKLVCINSAVKGLLHAASAGKCAQVEAFLQTPLFYHNLQKANWFALETFKCLYLAKPTPATKKLVNKMFKQLLATKLESDKVEYLLKTFGGLKTQPESKANWPLINKLLKACPDFNDHSELLPLIYLQEGNVKKLAELLDKNYCLFARVPKTATEAKIFQQALRKMDRTSLITSGKPVSPCILTHLGFETDIPADEITRNRMMEKAVFGGHKKLVERLLPHVRETHTAEFPGFLLCCPSNLFLTLLPVFAPSRNVRDYDSFTLIDVEDKIPMLPRQDSSVARLFVSSIVNRRLYPQLAQLLKHVNQPALNQFAMARCILAESIEGLQVVLQQTVQDGKWVHLLTDSAHNKEMAYHLSYAATSQPQNQPAKQMLAMLLKANLEVAAIEYANLIQNGIEDQKSCTENGSFRFPIHPGCGMQPWQQAVKPIISGLQQAIRVAGLSSKDISFPTKPGAFYWVKVQNQQLVVQAAKDNKGFIMPGTTAQFPWKSAEILDQITQPHS